jgi:hypothetical protein
MSMLPNTIIWLRYAHIPEKGAQQKTLSYEEKNTLNSHFPTRVPSLLQHDSLFALEALVCVGPFNSSFATLLYHDLETQE